MCATPSTAELLRREPDWEGRREPLGKPRQQLTLRLLVGRPRGRAVPADPQAPEVTRADGGAAQQEGVRRRHAEEPGDAFALERLEHLLGVEGGLDDVRAP